MYMCVHFSLVQCFGCGRAIVLFSTLVRNEAGTNLSAPVVPVTDDALEATYPNLSKLKKGLGGALYISNVEQLTVNSSTIRYSKAL